MVRNSFVVILHLGLNLPLPKAVRLVKAFQRGPVAFEQDSAIPAVRRKRSRALYLQSRTNILRAEIALVGDAGKLHYPQPLQRTRIPLVNHLAALQIDFLLQTYLCVKMALIL